MKNLLVSIVLLSVISAQAMKKDSSTQGAFKGTSHAGERELCVYQEPPYKSVKEILKEMKSDYRALSNAQRFIFKEELLSQSGACQLIDIDAAQEILASVRQQQCAVAPLDVDFKAWHQELSAKSQELLLSTRDYRVITPEEQKMCRQFDRFFDTKAVKGKEPLETILHAELHLRDMTNKFVQYTIQCALAHAFFRRDLIPMHRESGSFMVDLQEAGDNLVNLSSSSVAKYKDLIDRFFTIVNTYKKAF